MIAFLKGTLVAASNNEALIEVGGIGYRVAMPSLSLSKIGSVGSQVQVLTYMSVREDAVVLYGFSCEEEQSLFEKLITVSGVGSKVALSALSFFEPEALISAIAAQDEKAVQKIPGVGKKMASRIILELKDAFASATVGLYEGMQSSAPVALDSATEVLLSMGFTSQEASLALKGAPEDANESEVIRYALKRLGA
jgi:Holliday junction DNA helicase RuvA